MYSYLTEPYSSTPKSRDAGGQKLSISYAPLDTGTASCELGVLACLCQGPEMLRCPLALFANAYQLIAITKAN